MLIASTFPICQYVAMDVGNNVVGVRNDGVGVYDALVNTGNNYMCVRQEFGLETDS